MIDLVRSIANKDYVKADSILSEAVELIMVRKLEEAKKMCAAKMTEQGLDATASELRRKDIVELDVSKETPDYDSIEDKRTERAVNSSIKTNLGGDQEVSRRGKGDLNPQTPTRELKGNNKSNYNKSGSMADVFSEETEEQLDEARIKIIKARIRGGQIQRRKKISNVPGMTIRGGKLKRMSPAERRRRKMGQRKGKLKRRAKMSRTLMKRQRSLRKRKALGL